MKKIQENNKYLNTLIQGDCLEVMAEITTQSVDMILCDLPYGITRNDWDSIIPLDKLWGQYNRIIKDSGAIVLTASQPFSSLLVTSNIKNFKYALVWEKSLKTNFLNAKRQPLRCHEDILVFYKKQCTYNPQELQKGKISGGNKLTNSYGKWTSGESKQEYTNYPNSVIKIANPNHKNIHPTQKPVSLFEHLIKIYTNPGDIVLDSCIGSGTTAISCIKTQRYFIGIESDQSYYDNAIKRVNNFREIS